MHVPDLHVRSTPVVTQDVDLWFEEPERPEDSGGVAGRGRSVCRAKDRLVIPVLEDSLAASLVAARRGRRKVSLPGKRKSSP